MLDTSMDQVEIFSIIRNKIGKIRETKSKPIRVGINGIEGTGKTTFAIALVKYLNQQNCTAYHVGIDGFHFNKEVRYRQGRDSAKGYYEDSYDKNAFVEKVLLRSQQTPPEYIEATHDLLTDAYLELPPTSLNDESVIITDGCYLFKPVFNKYWDLRIYLKTDFDTALVRGAERDKVALNGYENAKQKFKLRYHKSSKRYIAEVNPEELADIIIDMTNFENMAILSGI